MFRGSNKGIERRNKEDEDQLESAVKNPEKSLNAKASLYELAARGERRVEGSLVDFRAKIQRTYRDDDIDARQRYKEDSGAEFDEAERERNQSEEMNVFQQEYHHKKALKEFIKEGSSSAAPPHVGAARVKTQWERGIHSEATKSFLQEISASTASQRGEVTQGITAADKRRELILQKQREAGLIE